LDYDSDGGFGYLDRCLEQKSVVKESALAASLQTGIQGNESTESLTDEVLGLELSWMDREAYVSRPGTYSYFEFKLVTWKQGSADRVCRPLVAACSFFENVCEHLD
jgi:hypothetical protein